MSIANPTLEDVWQLFREVAQGFKELKQQSQETDRRFQETDRRFQETDRRFQETDRRFQETDRKIQETTREIQMLKEQSAETERFLKEQSAETERFLKERSKETDKKIRAVSKQIGNLTNRLGEFVEEMVRPAVVRLFREHNIPINQVIRGLIAYDAQGRKLSEVDLLVVNTKVVVLVECKSQLTIDDVNDHIERLASFKINFHQYATYTVMGAVAGMVLQKNVDIYAYRKGLFVLAQSGNAMIICNDEKFEPHTW